MYVRAIEKKDEWEQIMLDCAAHPLQSWQWGALKEDGGAWTAYRLACIDEGVVVGGAQVLVRKLPFPFRALAYAPRGPFASDESRLPELCDCLADWCAGNTPSVCLKIEPQVASLALGDGWVAGDHVLLAKTATIDITPDEADIMKGIPNRKCRQYIRKAERDGIVVRPATEEDLDAILDLYHYTAEQDGFPLHVDEYYRTAFQVLEGVQHCFVACDGEGGEVQAFLWNVLQPGSTTFELWGAVSEAGKRSRANYYLKWCAIRAAKEAGSVLYDLNGLLNDGISDFKLLFAKEPTYWAGTFEKPLNHLYAAMGAAMGVRSAIYTIADRVRGA